MKPLWFLILLPLSLQAADTPVDPGYFTLGAFGANETLKFSCDVEANKVVVNCQTTFVSIRKRSDKERAKAIEELNKLDTMSDADFQKARTQFASMDVNKMQRRIALSSPEQAEGLKDFFENFKDAKAAIDRASLKAAMAKMEKMRDQTCSLRVTNGPMSFEKVSPRRWLSNPGPQGLCNVVTIKVLEQEPEHAYLWTYTETTVSADVEQQTCSWLKPTLNKPVRYSWDYPQTLVLGCKYFEVEQ